MKRKLLPLIFVGLSLCIAAIMSGCGGGNDNGGSVGDLGTATIRGNISSFETSDMTFVPLKERKESFMAKIISGVLETLIPSAHARGQLEGIVVYLEGPPRQSRHNNYRGWHICLFRTAPWDVSVAF